ncbi:hypothetical protein SHXM_02397 [Streptomyces hygroscopicus]|nr:hypothetical protein SHXM_02397 [Streptomyces hygroscopicus]
MKSPSSRDRREGAVRWAQSSSAAGGRCSGAAQPVERRVVEHHLAVARRDRGEGQLGQELVPGPVPLARLTGFRRAPFAFGMVVVGGRAQAGVRVEDVGERHGPAGAVAFDERVTVLPQLRRRHRVGCGETQRRGRALRLPQHLPVQGDFRVQPHVDLDRPVIGAQAAHRVQGLLPAAEPRAEAFRAVFVQQVADDGQFACLGGLAHGLEDLHRVPQRVGLAERGA